MPRTVQLTIGGCPFGRMAAPGVWTCVPYLLLLTAAPPLQAQEPARLGGQFEINTVATAVQDQAEVAMDADGNFVVVWGSQGSLGSDNQGFSIQAQRYGVDGSPLGPQFQVNSYTTGNQRWSSIAMAPGGDFVVIWASVGSAGGDTDGSSIQGQRFSADGTPQGSQFQVNSYTTGDQGAYQRVAMEADGDFVVAWTSTGSSGSDTDGTSVHGQRYDASGMPMGTEFQVNTYTTGDQGAYFGPAVATASTGDFVVVWGSYGSAGDDDSQGSIQAQRYASSGLPLGPEFQVNTFTTGAQWSPAVSYDLNDDFVVVWASTGAVHGQSFQLDGTPIGSWFQLPQVGGDLKMSAVVDGGFVVTGMEIGDGDGLGVSARQLTKLGAAVGAEFQVNSYTMGYQGRPAIAGAPGTDRFVVVWHSDGSSGADTDLTSIQGQRYALSIFGDGFESGDTSAWSSVSP